MYGPKSTKRTTKGKCSSSSGVIVAAGLFFAPGAHGQAATSTSAAVSDDLASGEIVVTAQRREERSLDVPILVTSINASQLTTANVQDLTDIAKVTPALRFDSTGSFVQPSIRGIGTGITTSGGGSNVGIYIDGFYSPNPAAADMQLLNVESIQVLKGPPRHAGW